MRKLSRLYRTINVLSIDVAFGAVCGALFFSRLINTKASLVSLLLLAASVWVIYTIDHLCDAFRLQCPAITERHLFHQKHFRKLVPIISVVVLFMVPLLILIERQVLIAGIVMAIFVILYLFILNRVRGIKELLIAALYCIGVSVPANSYDQYTLADFLIVIQFFTVCLMNLCVFAIFEIKEDREHRFQSVALLLGKRGTIFLLFVLLSINTAIAFVSDNLHYSLILLFMSVCHVVMLGYEYQLRQQGRYRLVGDAIFFIPVFVLWAPGT